jgi:Trp operon repressor
MSKIDPRRLPKGRRDELTGEVLRTFEKFGLKEDGKMLLRGIVTESEMVMLSRRLHIARRLIAGHSFQKISADLGVGLATTRFVHDWLEQKFDDYRSFLHSHVANDGEILSNISLQAIRHRYPMSFSLFKTLIQNPLKDEEMASMLR